MSDTVADGLVRLLDVMSRLRDPDSGCPWDCAQDFSTIAPFTIEEAYEVADAIATGRPDELRDELGDLLFQVVFHSRIAQEKGWFEFEDVVRSITDKLIRRHPHVFAGGKMDSIEAQSRSWEDIKAAERADKSSGSGLLDGVPVGLPGLTRAAKLQRRAARVNFDWPDWSGPMNKLVEETGELLQVLEKEEPGIDAVELELGDVLFTCANIARHAGVDPESALRAANRKFELRIREMERLASDQGQSLGNLEETALDCLWESAKRSLSQKT